MVAGMSRDALTDKLADDIFPVDESGALLQPELHVTQSSFDWSEALKWLHRQVARLTFILRCQQMS